jgi:hypothetical protein
VPCGAAVKLGWSLRKPDVGATLLRPLRGFVCENRKRVTTFDPVALTLTRC